MWMLDASADNYHQLTVDIDLKSSSIQKVKIADTSYSASSSDNIITEVLRYGNHNFTRTNVSTSMSILLLLLVQQRKVFNCQHFSKHTKAPVLCYEMAFNRKVHEKCGRFRGISLARSVSLIMN